MHFVLMYFMYIMYMLCFCIFYSYAIYEWPEFYLNKDVFCSVNKDFCKIVPDQTAFIFLYKTLHATYLVMSLSSTDSFQNKYFQEISGKKSRCQIVWIQIRTKHSVDPDLTPNCP